MADIVYTVNQDTPETIAGFEQYSQEDKALVSSFQINSVFDPAKHYSELHILSLSDELLESSYTYSSYKLLGNAQSAGQAGASVLTIDPIQDSKAYGYENGGVKLLYHFLDDLYSEDTNTVEFYIQSISPDRTELSLSTLNLTPEVVAAITSNIKNNLQSQSYFTGFRLDFKNNDLFIATNIDTLNTDAGQVVVVKLYEPLPTIYNLKSTLNIVDVVSDSVAYEVDAEFIIAPTVAPTLRSPNFNIEITDHSVIPTEYFSYDDLFSYPVTNANSQIFSTVNEKGIDISVDYTNFSDFVHFSSAQERLLNFKYKLDLVASYSQSIASGSGATTGLLAVSGSRTYYENLITGVVNNFDHYERFLYYESGSSSWPKSNTTKPYTNKPSSDSESIIWYANQIDNSIQYDLTNYSSLVYSIPTYLRDDANNENYLTFVYMVGQHFDNLWLYSKAVTDKYDADNRIDKGISKDLVAEALKNFGVKLYTSNKSVEDLFTTFIGQAYQSGSEVINTYITGSLTGSNTPIQPTSYDSYEKEVQKRIYHNLPLLLKSKGTERGLRALINCLGIPGDILDIKLYGGRNTNERPFFGDYQYYTSSLDKIRLDNTGSLVSGSTLSNSVSIIKRDSKYTDDLHAIEVGFSPTDSIDQQILRQLACVSYTIELDIRKAPPKTTYGYEYTDCSGKGQRGSIDTDTYVDAVIVYAIEGTLVVESSEFITVTQNTTNQSNFNIDSYLGDPSNLTLDNYSGLGAVASGLLSGSLGTATNYNLQDFVRLIKFFDNTVFKMVKDFIPARAVVDTGIIIKPNLLNRSKAKSVTVSGTQPEYSGSIDTAFITGSDGGAFITSTGTSDTSWIEVLQTPQGLANSYVNQGTGQPLFTGELGGAELMVSDGELNDANPFKHIEYDNSTKNVIAIQDFPANICAITTTYPSVNIRTPQSVDLRSAFNIPGDNYVTYKSGSTDITSTASSFPMLTNYTTYAITASKAGIVGCSGSKVYTTGFCSIALTTAGTIPIVQQNTPYDLTTWFSSTYNNINTLTYTLYDTTANTSANITNSGSYIFTSDTGSYVYIQVNDPLVVGGCIQQTNPIQVQPQVQVSVDPPGGNYTYISQSQGPASSTLTGRTYPETGRTYRYYGAPFTGSTYTTSSTPPVDSGNYKAYVTVPADAFYPTISSAIQPFIIDKNVLIIKANDRAVDLNTSMSIVTASISNSFTVTNLQGGLSGDTTSSVITGTVTYTTNYTTSSTVGTTGLYITPVITGLSAVNYTFVGVSGSITVGSTIYNPNQYSATDYLTGSA
ncbi:hypothetical protein UFOVP54_79 [uncultured Caudovirales phage]|uniref:Uncharacterized protein n=1 Tax=uncultured Caudovirales phage TaxID=2100421 RepID=A0A6J5KVX1_9CAUD|nr:hypothetical protein UFOVP54_79 [uncultured Caudovirales phage]